MSWIMELSEFWGRHADPSLVAQATDALAGASPEALQQVELDLLDDAFSAARAGDDPHNDARLHERALRLTVDAHMAARDGTGWESVLDAAHSLWLHAAKGPTLRVVDTVRAAAPLDVGRRHATDGWDTQAVSHSPHRVVRATLNAVFGGMHSVQWAAQALTQMLRDRYPRDGGEVAQTTDHYTLAADRRAAALAEKQLATVRLAFRLPDPRVMMVEPPPLEWYGPPAPADLLPAGRYDVALTPAQAAEVGVLDHKALPAEWDSWGGPALSAEERAMSGRLPPSWRWTDNSRRPGVRHCSRVRHDQRVPLTVWASATGADVDTLIRAISEQSEDVVGPAGLALELARRAMKRVEQALPQNDDYTPALSCASIARLELSEAERWAERRGRGPVHRVWACARAALKCAAEAADHLGLGADDERAQQREDLLSLVAP